MTEVFGVPLVAVVAVPIVVLVVAVVVARMYMNRWEEKIDQEIANVEAQTDGGTVVEFPSPTIQSRSGMFGEFWTFWRTRQKRKKLAGKGYVQWYVIDDAWPSPKYIKPERKGRGMPEYEHDGKTYLFPENAALPDRQQGLRTIVHKKGDAIPINIDEPGKPAVEPDKVKEYLTLALSASPPGLLDQFDLEPEHLVYGGIGLILAAAAVKQLGVF